MKLKAGIKGIKTIKVTAADTASSLGSGDVDVFGTPAMVALMEETSRESVLHHLETGYVTVGTGLNIRHLASTPIGLQVTCESELTEVSGRTLVFVVKVSDGHELVGDGTHTRMIVNRQRFQQKAEEKRNRDGGTATQNES